MLLDVRTYTCRPGTIKKHLELYAKMGAEPQSRNLGKPLLYMTTETGNPNQYVHIWAYENAGDREAKRKNLWADPDWLAYVQESGKLGALRRRRAAQRRVAGARARFVGRRLPGRRGAVPRGVACGADAVSYTHLTLPTKA